MEKKINFKGKIILQSTLKRNWERIKPVKPFPNIKAWVISKEEYENIIKINEEYQSRGKDPHLNEIREYGEILEESGSESYAFSTYIDILDLFYIWIREDSPYRINSDLRHELEHIHKVEGEPQGDKPFYL